MPRNVLSSGAKDAASLPRANGVKKGGAKQIKVSSPVSSSKTAKIAVVKKTASKKMPAPKPIKKDVSPKKNLESTKQKKYVSSTPKLVAKKPLTPSPAIDSKARSAERMISRLKNKKKTSAHSRAVADFGIPPSMDLQNDVLPIMSSSESTVIMPRKQSRLAVGVAVFSLALMTTAGLASFGPSRAATGQSDSEVPQAPATAVAPATSHPLVTTADPGTYSLIGKVTTVQNATITILTISPSGGTRHAKEYTVTISPDTGLFHQIPIKQNENSLAYKVVQGKKNEIQPGNFVSMTTNDNTGTLDTVRAATLNYSEMSPFNNN